jgi:predicted CXXCH cytochrome family protein
VTGFDTATGRFEERGTSCPACHGDGGAHAASGGVQGILRPASLPALRRAEICGSCHSRGRDRKTGRPYPTAYVPGGSLEESFALEAPAPGAATAFFWPDGTERTTYMEFQGFKQSGHARAGLACTTCHLAHGSDYPYNLRHKTADLCQSCHPKAADDTPVHRSHPRGKATCVDCHMAVVNPARDEAHTHTHTFRFLEPSRSVATGMPNACAGACHADKDARWAEEAVRRWRGR